VSFETGDRIVVVEGLRRGRRGTVRDVECDGRLFLELDEVPCASARDRALVGETEQSRVGWWEPHEVEHVDPVERLASLDDSTT